MVIIQSRFVQNMTNSSKTQIDFSEAARNAKKGLVLLAREGDPSAAAKGKRIAKKLIAGEPLTGKEKRIRKMYVNDWAREGRPISGKIYTDFLLVGGQER